MSVILHIILRSLSVKHTRSYIDALYVEHPDRDNMYGISSILKEFGINSYGLFLSEKEEVKNIQCPFIAHFKSEFVVVHDFSDQKVKYQRETGEMICDTFESFLSLFDGNILILEADQTAIEPEYRKHRIKESISLLSTLGIIISTIIIGLLLVISHFYDYHTNVVIYTIIQGLGVFICTLLLLKQLKHTNSFTDKICSLFDKKGCDRVLNSDAAKIFYYFSWSEVGFGYFISNLVLLIATPSLAGVIVIANTLVLPYCIWSVWYQKEVMKQWCGLCLTVLSLILASFLVAVLSQMFPNEITLIQILFVFCFYLLIVLITNRLMTIVANGVDEESTKKRLNTVIKTKSVFEVLLHEQTFYKIPDTISTIIIGPPKADYSLTIISNPHCNPCASMHKEMSQLLKDGSDFFNVKYVLTAFNDELIESNQMLIAACQNNNPVEVLDKWFFGGKKDVSAFRDFYQLNDEYSQGIIEEVEKQLSWVKESGIDATPTVLVNGYLLPPIYNVKDLHYLFY